MQSKLEQYNKLVNQRKKCNLCQPNLVNPAMIQESYDGSEIGLWSEWQNCLDADIVLIGQDWGTVKNFMEQKGKDLNKTNNNSQNTNGNIVKLFNTIGIDIELPSSDIKNDRLFFTNQVLCLRKDNNVNLEILDNWDCCRRCGDKFLKPLIDLINPKVIVTLGRFAFRNLMESYREDIREEFDVDVFEITRMTYEELVDIGHIPLRYGTVIIPVYHCSPVQRRRNINQQIEDWQEIKEFI